MGGGCGCAKARENPVRTKAGRVLVAKGSKATASKLLRARKKMKSLGLEGPDSVKTGKRTRMTYESAQQILHRKTRKNPVESSTAFVEGDEVVFKSKKYEVIGVDADDQGRTRLLPLSGGREIYVDPDKLKVVSTTSYKRRDDGKDTAGAKTVTAYWMHGNKLKSLKLGTASNAREASAFGTKYPHSAKAGLMSGEYAVPVGNTQEHLQQVIAYLSRIGVGSVERANPSTRRASRGPQHLDEFFEAQFGG